MADARAGPRPRACQRRERAVKPACAEAAQQQSVAKALPRRPTAAPRVCPSARSAARNQRKQKTIQRAAPRAAPSPSRHGARAAAGCTHRGESKPFLGGVRLCRQVWVVRRGRACATEQRSLAPSAPKWTRAATQGPSVRSPGHDGVRSPLCHGKQARCRVSARPLQSAAAASAPRARPPARQPAAPWPTAPGRQGRTCAPSAPHGARAAGGGRRGQPAG